MVLFKGLRLFFIELILVLSSSGMAAHAEVLRIVGFGDSLMAGYQLEKHEGFPARLQAALIASGHDVEIIDAGVSGDTTSGGLARIDWSIPEGTHGVILELGANDALRGISPERTRENLAAMIVALKTRGIAVLLAGTLAPPNMGPAYEAEFNPIYPELAAKYDVMLYPFFLDGVTTFRDRVLADGMHPNAIGVEEMVRRFLPTAEKFLADLDVHGPD